jgi:hypothetical protein
MVAIRFALSTSTPLGSNPWTIYVRVDWPDRDDRLSKDDSPSVSQFRRALSPKRLRFPRQREAADWSRSEDIWMPEDRKKVRWRDLDAQIALFLLQVDLVNDPEASDLASYLITYFRTEFRFSQEAAHAVFEKALTRHWWPDGWRSWQSYLRRTARFDQIEMLGRRPPRLHTDEDLLTVDAASQLSSVKKSTLYDLVKRHCIVSTRDESGRIWRTGSPTRPLGSGFSDGEWPVGQSMNSYEGCSSDRSFTLNPHDACRMITSQQL